MGHTEMSHIVSMEQILLGLLIFIQVQAAQALRASPYIMINFILVPIAVPMEEKCGYMMGQMYR